MRIVETLHNNAAMRTFTVDKPLCEGRIFYSRETDFIGKDLKLAVLFDHTSKGPLVKSVTVFEHGVRVEMHEAYADNKEDWDAIRDNVFYCFANFFDMNVNDIADGHSIKDDRNPEYKGGVPNKATVTLYGLAEALKVIAIPHDFKTHREAWRNAIVAAKVNAESIKHLDDSNFLYWEHELKAFDAAFDALEALKLPEK